MKTIIVPLDFSKESLTGLDLSIMLANRTGATIQMVHVIEDKIDINNESPDEAYQQAKLKFENVLQKYKEKGSSNYILHYEIKEGKVFKEITNLAENYDDALIVLSAHGRSGFEELFIGGNAYKITSHSKNPVITVRSNKISSNHEKTGL